MTKSNEVANCSGIVSLAAMLLLWLWIRDHAPVTNVYVLFVGNPAFSVFSLIAAIIAIVKGSKWWWIAVFPPIITALNLLAAG